jgi:6-phosphofructokinase 1
VIPGVETDPELIAAELRGAYDRCKAHAIVVVAKGTEYNAEKLTRYFKRRRERLGFDLRVTILGHIQRGGAPGVFDRLLATRFGAAAIERLSRGEHGVLVGLIKGEIAVTPLDEVVANKKALDRAYLNWPGRWQSKGKCHKHRVKSPTSSRENPQR